MSRTTAEPAPPCVRFGAGPQNLASLLVGRLLGRAARLDPVRARRLASRSVRVSADGMTATLRGCGDAIVVTAGDDGPADAALSGDLAALVAALRRGLLRSLVTGRLRIRGRPGALLNLRALLAAATRGS